MLEYSFFKFLYTIFMFALILAVTYYVTRFIARKGAVKSRTKNMKVVESLPLGMDKSLLLVKVGKQYVLLGNSSKSLTYFSSFDHDKLGLFEGDTEVEEYTDSFDTYLDELKDEQESFYANPVKSNLNKLKALVRGTKNNE
ncbi:MAG: flagellar biosynthetic protein FliO [Bacillota bacterium]